MRIHSIFSTLEGEGIFVGIPQIFIRLQGCKFRCLNCDTKSSWDIHLGKEQSIDAILKKVKSFKIKRVSLTGGDIALQEDELILLIKKLKKLKYFINGEVNGDNVNNFFDLLDFISYDIKTPSTGKNSAKDISNLITMQDKYLGKFQIKSVIEDDTDFRYILKIAKKINFKNQFPWVITPAYNTDEFNPQNRFKRIEKLLKKYPYFRMIIQQHKIIYGSKDLSV